MKIKIFFSLVSLIFLTIGINLFFSTMFNKINNLDFKFHNQNKFLTYSEKILEDIEDKIRSNISKSGKYIIDPDFPATLTLYGSRRRCKTIFEHKACRYQTSFKYTKRYISDSCRSENKNWCVKQNQKRSAIRHNVSYWVDFKDDNDFPINVLHVLIYDIDLDYLNHPDYGIFPNNYYKPHVNHFIFNWGDENLDKLMNYLKKGIMNKTQKSVTVHGTTERLVDPNEI